jgi:hypothetical protein
MDVFHFHISFLKSAFQVTNINQEGKQFMSPCVRLTE